MNEQSANSVSGASSGTDFQPSTQNPQGNVNTTLQTTGAGLQSAGGNVLGANTNILVPTQTGSVVVTPATSQAVQQPISPKHPPLLVWLGIGLVLICLAAMAVGLLRPRKYS